MKAKLTHVALLVTNLEKARYFYSDLLGLQEITRPPYFIQGIWYDLGEFELHLMLYEQAASPQIHPLNDTVQPHFALTITQLQMMSILEKLKNAAIQFVIEPEQETARSQVFFYDYDKNMIELNV